MNSVEIVLLIMVSILWINVGIRSTVEWLGLDEDYIFEARDTPRDTWGPCFLWLKLLVILTSPILLVWYNNWIVLPFDPSRNDDIELPDNIDDL